jgi:hypothetical protein
MKRIIPGLLIVFFAANLMAQSKPTPTVEVDGKKLQVMNLDAKDRVTWGGYTQIGDAARSESDGMANTKAIIATVGNNPDYKNKPYAASLCAGLKANGFEDWYLPSVNELKGLFKSAKAIGFGNKNTYWSSTETNGTQAMSVYMYNGKLYKNAKVNQNHYACVRNAG